MRLSVQLSAQLSITEFSCVKYNFLTLRLLLQHSEIGRGCIASDIILFYVTFRYPVSESQYPLLFVISHSPKPLWPIRSQDTKIGGYHLLFPLTFVQGRGEGWTASQVENVTHFWIQPSPDTASHNLDGPIRWYPYIQSSSMLLLHLSTQIHYHTILTTRVDRSVPYSLHLKAGQ